MRFRNISMILGSLATFLLVFLSDPDLGPGMNMIFGAQTLLALKTIVTASLACLVIHLSSKTLFDYIHRLEFFLKAKETAQGAGLALIALAIYMVAAAIVFVALISHI